MRVTEIAKENDFKGVWVELAPKNDFQRQPLTKYLRLTLVLMGSSALREMFTFCFSRVLS